MQYRTLDVRRIVIALLILPLVGCAPGPRVERLSSNELARVDLAWKNMFNPIDKLDRAALLEVVLALKLWYYGIDSMCVSVEKEISSGHLEMRLRYSRSSDGDSYCELELTDKSGRTLRKERFTFEEIQRFEGPDALSNLHARIRNREQWQQEQDALDRRIQSATSSE